MGLFICEKCGCIDNTACDNTYYIASLNKLKRKRGKKYSLSLNQSSSISKIMHVVRNAARESSIMMEISSGRDMK